MIPQNVIDELLNKVSIVDVIGRFTEIKKSGKNFLALCPFHKEKTPSFSISEDKGLYHCFGCGVSGNTVKFLMEYQKLSFTEALQDLAKMAGMDLKQYYSADTSYSSKEKEGLLSVNREAMLYYHEILLSSPEAQEARDYFKKRKMTLDTVKTYRLGFGGTSWTGLLEHLKQKGFSEKDIEKAGLAISGNRGFYDRFKDRVLFPIFDREGNPVGFGGRILTDTKDTAKYINTSENQLFKKGTLLFSLNLARDEISREKKAFLVEGYMDVIALYQHGIKHAVAPLGTSFTEQQLAVLKRYTDTVYFLFDGDDAGINAANRALDLAVASDLTQWVVILPEKKDPYDYVMEKGRDNFNLYVEKKRMMPIDFKIRYFTRKMDIGSQKVKFIAAIFPYLARLKSPIAREDGLKRIAGFLQERYEVILAEYQSFLRDDKSVGKSIRESAAAKSDLNRQELNFISLLTLFPNMAPEARKIIGPEMLDNQDVKDILELVSQNPGKPTREIVNTIENPEIIALVSELAQSENLRESLVREIAYKLKLLYIKREITRNAAQIRQYETESKNDEVRKLMQEKQDLVAVAAETEKYFREFEIQE